MAEPILWSNELVLNNITTDIQTLHSTAALKNGGFVAVWRDANITNLRFFDAEGDAIALSKKINNTDAGNYARTSVAVLDNGDIVIGWVNRVGTSNPEAKLQRFSSTGVEKGPEISLGPTQSTNVFPEGEIKIITLTNGGYVVAWDDQSANNILFRVFKADGTTVTSKTIDLAGVTHEFFDITKGANGTFTVDYSARSASGAPYDLHGVKFSSSGAQIGSNSVLLSSNVREPSSILLANGGRAIVYAEGIAPLKMVIYNATGSVAVQPFILESTQESYFEPAVAQLRDGRIVAAWVSKEQGQTGNVADNVYARIINPDGTFNTDRFAVNDINSSTVSEHYPSITVLADGRFVISWDKGNPYNGGGGAGDIVDINARIYDPRETGINLQADDFANRLHGTNFTDTIKGGAGSDTIFGAGGNDKLHGQSGNDTLRGDGGNDELYGNAGKDKLIGGAGNDMASYKADGAVTVSLDGSLTKSGAAVGDTFSSIENLEGSTANDRLAGDAIGNVISGLAGTDTIFGRSGGDTLIGGTGKDTLTGGSGADSFAYTAVSHGGDLITDFTEFDSFIFRAAAFGFGTASGPLPEEALQVRSSNIANNSVVRFIFRTGDDTLWYDADGNGAGAARMMADLRNNYTTMSADDIVLI